MPSRNRDLDAESAEEQRQKELHIFRAQANDELNAMTEAFDLTPEQHELVQSIATAIAAASQFGCMPTMTVTEHTEETTDE